MRREPWLHSTVLALTLLTALALAVRLPQLDDSVFVDELLHVLAARSFLDSGTLQINEGEPYTRARLFTFGVAGMFRVFGESLVVARIPALIAGIGLVLTLFLWVRSVASRTAAWTAAVLLCLNPEAIYLSAWCRFYTLQTLFLLLGAIASYVWVHGSVTRNARVWLALALLSCLALAMLFQVSSTISIMALALWAGLTTGPALLGRLRGPRAAWYGLGATLVILLLTALILESGFAQYAWRLFQYSAPWAASGRENYFFYHSSLLGKYATLWTLFPLAWLLAFSTRPRPAWFCGSIFGAGLVIQSIAAWKSDRYFFWAMPFFFAIIGMAFDPAVRWIQSKLEAALAAHGPRALRPARIRTAVGGAVAVALAFTAVGNAAFRQSYGLIRNDDLRRPVRVEPNWKAATPALREAAGGSEAVLSSSGPKSLYFLERLDFVLSSQLHDDSSSEVGISKFLGVPRIRTPDSLRRVMGCHGSGLVIIERSHSGKKVSSEVVEYLKQQADELPLPPDWRLLAWRWDRPRVDLGLDCDLAPE